MLVTYVMLVTVYLFFVFLFSFIFFFLSLLFFFFFSSRRRHTRCLSDWSSDVCSSDLGLSTDGLILFCPSSCSSNPRFQRRYLVIALPRALARQFRAVLRRCSPSRSEEHTSELQSLRHLVCRLLLEKKKNKLTQESSKY